MRRGQRSVKGDFIPKHDKVLEALRRRRDEVIEAGRHVRPMGPAHHALHVVVSATDTLPTFVTGNLGYFVVKGHPTPGEPSYGKREGD